MASLYQLKLGAQLEYDARLGHTNLDSGSGPPEGVGWARSGADVNIVCGPAGSPWTSAAGTDNGTIARTLRTPEGIVRFEYQITPCDLQLKIWCIER